MATLSNTDLRNGTVYEDGGDVYVVIKYSPSTRGRGSSIVRVRVRNLKTGNVLEKTYRDNEKVESADTRRVSVQYLYKDTSNAFFMDGQTYEQFSMPLEAVGDCIEYMKDGEKVIVLYLDDSPISVEIPKSVVLEIKHTEPAVKGNTATNAMKKATLENDLVVDVPLFSKNGDKVKINTDTGTYVSRA